MLYEILEHTADLKLKASDCNLEKLFLNLAFGVCEVMVPDLIRKDSQRRRIIKATGFDNESLLVNFLNEIIYLSDTRREVYKNFKFKKFEPGKQIEVEAKVVKADKKEIEIKAATYHDLRIEKNKNQWEAVVTFDI